MIRVLFICSLKTPDSPDFINKPLKSPEHIYMGISYISSILKQHGHKTNLLVLSSTFGKRSTSLVEDMLNRFSPQVICFTAVATQYSFITRVARKIKSKYPGIVLIIGGAHVSMNSEEAIQDIYDVVCIGEGEYPILEYITKMEEGRLPRGIQNLWIKENGKVERSDTRKFLADIDNMPFMDREMWWPYIAEHPDWRFTVLLGRGCPFNCSYCSNHSLRRLASGSYVRCRSPENIVQEINDLHEKYPFVKEFYLEVETINSNRKWALELCLQLKRLNDSLSSPLSFGVNLKLTDRPGLEELFAAFKEANFRFINIGLESGSERVRREILRRKYSNDTVINTVRLAREYGLQVAFYNLIGLPGESISDFKETIKINKVCQPDWHITSIFFPYPGTDLYDLCLEKGFIKKGIGLYGERNVAVLDLPDFSKRQIQKCYTEFHYYVYGGPRSRFHVLFTAIEVTIKLHPYFGRFYSLFHKFYVYLDSWTGIRTVVRKLSH